MTTILVTGGAGFIGSHVVELIQAAGDTAVVVDDLSKGSLANLPGDVAVTEASIADRAAMQRLAADLTNVQAIIHCAAQASVVASTEDLAELAAREFIAADRYTMADIVMQTTFDFGRFIGVDIPDELTNLKAWDTRVSNRPGATFNVPDNVLAIARRGAG